MENMEICPAIKGDRTQLYVINYRIDHQGSFLNYLQKYDFYLNIMRKKRL